MRKYTKDFGAEYGLKYDSLYGLILLDRNPLWRDKTRRLKDKRDFVCLGFFVNRVTAESPCGICRWRYGTVSSGIYSQCPGRMARSRF